MDENNKDTGALADQGAARPADGRPAAGGRGAKTLRQKLADARAMLIRDGMRKSGQNPAMRFDYFELRDFLPKINLICSEVGLATRTSFDLKTRTATLEVLDADSDERLEFAIPIEPVQLPRGTAMQNLGAMITYARRYLYIIAFEISVADTLDSMAPAARPAPAPRPAAPQDARAALLALGVDLGRVAAFYGRPDPDALTADELADALARKTAAARPAGRRSFEQAVGV